MMMILTPAHVNNIIMFFFSFPSKGINDVNLNQTHL